MSMAVSVGERAPLRLPEFSLPYLQRWMLWPAAAAFVFWMAALALARLDHAVTTLEVEGSFTQVPPAAVREVLRPVLGDTLFAVPLEEVRARVLTLPWVARAEVERVWPAGLRVRITERQATARWGAQGALDGEAMVFAPPAKDLPAGLPELAGPVGREQEVWETWQRLSEALGPTPFAPARLSLDARGEWRLATVGGIELRFGKTAPEAELDLIRQELSRTLAARLAQVEFVDLRYANGFAVGWKPLPQDAAAGE